MPRPRNLSQIPAHVRAAGGPPPGIYWDPSGRGHWYQHWRETAGAPVRRRRVAGPTALASELAAIAEAREGPARGTVDHVCAQFEASPQWGNLAPRTQHDYRQQRRIAGQVATRIGPLGQLVVDRLTTPIMQRIVDHIAARTPTKANHMLRYLRRVFAWGISRGHCATNPCTGVQAARERKLRRLPPHDVVDRVIAYARDRGARPSRTAGAQPPYLWAVAEIALQCRLRGIEVITLTDAHISAEGVRTNRRKGSRDNLTRWSPRLRAAYDAAIAHRAATWARRRTPTQIAPSARPIIVGDKGGALTDSAIGSAWQRLMRAAVADGVITTAERFGLHDMKRRGITDTPGRDHKLAAGGHRSEQMLGVYDLEVPVVDATDVARRGRGGVVTE